MGVRSQLIVTALLLGTAGGAYSQEVKFKRSMYQRGSIITDSASTLMIPIDAEEFISSKSGDYYCANMLVYNFNTDASFRLFDRNVHLLGYRTYLSAFPVRDRFDKKAARDWILYEIKVDHNNNGKMDTGDPVILYCSNVRGGNLKQLTVEKENLISIEIYQKQNFALLTLQRDMTNDLEFDNRDRDYYYVKLDLSTLTLGNKIELK